MLLQIDFDVLDYRLDPIIYSSHDDWSANLKTILDWSPYASKEDLLSQVWKLHLTLVNNYHELITILIATLPPLSPHIYST